MNTTDRPTEGGRGGRGLICVWARETQLTWSCDTHRRELPDPVIPSASYSALVHALDGAESGDAVSEQQIGQIREVIPPARDLATRE